MCSQDNAPANHAAASRKAMVDLPAPDGPTNRTARPSISTAAACKQKSACPSASIPSISIPASAYATSLAYAAFQMPPSQLSARIVKSELVPEIETSAFSTGPVSRTDQPGIRITMAFQRDVTSRPGATETVSSRPSPANASHVPLSFKIGRRSGYSRGACFARIRWSVRRCMFSRRAVSETLRSHCSYTR